MNDTTEEILRTFFDHEEQLKRLYDEQIIQLVRFPLLFLYFLRTMRFYIGLKFRT